MRRFLCVGLALAATAILALPLASSAEASPVLSIEAAAPSIDVLAPVPADLVVIEVATVDFLAVGSFGLLPVSTATGRSAMRLARGDGHGTGVSALRHPTRLTFARAPTGPERSRI